jgi:translation initiation factor RLI1
MQTPEGYKNKFLPKPPKRLAVIDQDACTGCAGAPTCVTFCETVTAGKGKQVDAIRLVDSPERPFSICVVEYEKCIGCALCARVCPWDAITMYNFDEAYPIHAQVTVVDWDPKEDRPVPVAPVPA